MTGICTKDAGDDEDAPVSWIWVDECSGSLREVFTRYTSFAVTHIVEKSRIVTDQLILAARLDRL